MYKYFLQNKIFSNRYLFSFFIAILFASLFIITFSFAQKVFALDIVVTEEVTINATVAGVIISPPSGGGGVSIPNTSVRFSGRAYPSATVSLLKNGKLQSSVEADDKAYFSITLPEKYDGDVLYTLYAKDTSNTKSLFLNFPLHIQSGYLTYLDGILFAPTISTDKSESLAGDYLTVFGHAIPKGKMQISIDGEVKKTFTLSAKNDGTYKTVLPLGDLPRGEYVVYINYENDARISRLVNLVIGNVNIFKAPETEDLPGDCNKDSIINLTDFSVLAFWYGKNNPPKCVDTNNDNIINLTDFSILAFYWNG